MLLISVLVFTSCEMNFVDPKPVISKSTPTAPIQTRNLNILGSDFFNWDSIEFRPNRIFTVDFSTRRNIEFISTGSDTLTLSFEKMNDDVETPYYCGFPQCKASLNKLGGNKISSTGSEGVIVYDQFSSDSADLIFEINQRTNYRLPDNTKLTAKVKGRFRVPRLD